jgi:hypothetical protein
MAEGLTKIIKDIAGMKMEPDADMPFLISIETDILNYLKPPVPGQGGQPGGPGGAPQGPPMGGPPGGAMGQAMGQVMGQPQGPPPGMMGGPMAAIAGGGGVMAGPGPGMPNPDEFRRGLGTAAIRGASRQLVHRMLNLNPTT